MANIVVGGETAAQAIALNKKNIVVGFEIRNGNMIVSATKVVQGHNRVETS